MKKYISLILLTCCIVLHIQAQKQLELISPNKEITVAIRLSDKIYYDISCNDELLLKNSSLLLQLKNQTLGKDPKLSSQKKNSVKETLTPIVPFKFSSVDRRIQNRL